ncbi:bifunctional pyr operon transcriptional regulator/uracil phosphoribosyltransferase PyrR [bacterium]|nr:bifunctional pyr operon transcriptional regulator/uracil phosphoribosyltransferase PyrR [bacterium]
MSEKEVLDSRGIEKTIARMADQVAALVQDPGQTALVGIRSYGVTVARRIQKILEEKHGYSVPLGILDITMYRDDLHRLDQYPVMQPTHLEFDLTGRTLLLFDDVLYTGRTVRCAMDQLMDYGRPKTIRLVVLVDRGHRELPIQPDIVGLTLQTSAEEKVMVHFSEEESGEDRVVVTGR